MLPERHVDTFRDVAEFPADEAKRMLEFVAEVARAPGWTTTACVVNVVREAARRSSTYTGTFWAGG